MTASARSRRPPDGDSQAGAAAAAAAAALALNSEALKSRCPAGLSKKRITTHWHPTQRGLAVLRRLDSVSLGGRAGRAESLLGPDTVTHWQRTQPGLRSSVKHCGTASAISDDSKAMNLKEKLEGAAVARTRKPAEFGKVPA